MGNLYHCTLTFSCRLSPPSSRSLQSVLDFFYSLEGLGTFGTSHLPGGVENSNLPGGGSHYPSSIWGVQLPEVGTSHISWGVQLHANGSSHSPGRVQLPVVGTSNPPWGSYYLWLETLIHLGGSCYLWLGPIPQLGGGGLQPAISHSKSYVLHVQNFSIFFSS